MEQNKLRERSLRPQDGAVALLSAAGLTLPLLLYGHLLLGITLSAGIIIIYLQLTRGNTNDALVLTVLWAIFATGVYTQNILWILLSGNFCSICYAAWRKYVRN